MVLRHLAYYLIGGNVNRHERRKRAKLQRTNQHNKRELGLKPLIQRLISEIEQEDDNDTTDRPITEDNEHAE